MKRYLRIIIASLVSLSLVAAWFGKTSNAATWPTLGVNEAWDAQEEAYSNPLPVVDNGPSKVIWVNVDVDDLTENNWVPQLKSAGYRVICYLVTGAWESYRFDASLFPPEVIGRSTGWNGERWLDIRPGSVPKFWWIIEARLDRARDLGCEVVDPDQNNPYENNPGFPITLADQKAYYLKVADAVHARGMGVLMKNGVEHLPDADLVAAFDGAMVEQCHQYSECDVWRAFVAAGKPVHAVEYAARRKLNQKAMRICGDMNNWGFLGIVKTNPMSGRNRVACR
jgi:hypothetical protein